MHRIIGEATAILEKYQATTFRRPEVVAEAVSQLVVSVVPVLKTLILPEVSIGDTVSGRLLLSSSHPRGYMQFISAIDSTDRTNAEVGAFLSVLRATVPQSLSWNEPETVQPAAAAALTLLIFSKPKDRKVTLVEWADLIRRKPSSRTSMHGNGYFYVLALAQPLVGTLHEQNVAEDLVSAAFLGRWDSDKEIETRVAVLQSLWQGQLLRTAPGPFLGLLEDGLNDFTTNARGDVGSHVRVEALKAVQAVWETSHDQLDDKTDTSTSVLFPGVLRLCAEKLDRVRPVAQNALAVAMQAE
jgi:hypothetical protein